MMVRKWFLAAVPLTALCFTGCDVDVKDPGEAPDVQVDPGRAPDVDVRGPDVDVKSRETTIDVPDVDVDVKSKEKKVTVPDIDVDVPEENETAPADASE